MQIKMNSYLPYKFIIKYALIVALTLFTYSDVYSEEIEKDTLTIVEEKFIEPELSDCSFGFDMLDNGFPYDGEIFKDIAEELDLSKVKSCLSKDTKYRVILKVLIDSTGNLAVSNILISSGFKQTDVEALRVINSLNKLTIPIQNGKPISVSISIPVLFKLEE